MTQTATRTPVRLGRDYWRLWWANTISSTGDGAFAAALPLLAVTITRDPRLVSVVTAATYLPWLLLSLPAGAVVDRYDRTALMWQAQAVQGAVVAVGQAILVLLATQTLHVSSRGYGLLLAASAVGSVVGGLVNPVLSRRLGLLPSLVLPAVADAAAFVGIGLAPDAAAAAGLLAVQGFSVTLWNVVTVSLRQRIVPGHLLGRVNSVYRMLGWGLMPLGALAGGFIAHAAGPRAPYLVGGLLCLLSSLAALPLLLAANRPAPPPPLQRQAPGCGACGTR